MNKIYLVEYSTFGEIQVYKYCSTYETALKFKKDLEQTIQKAKENYKLKYGSNYDNDIHIIETQTTYNDNINEIENRLDYFNNIVHPELLYSDIRIIEKPLD